MEKLLKELRALLQPFGVQTEPASTSIPAPKPSTVPIPNPSPDVVTPPIDRPLLQEAIPEINTEDIASLKTWTAGRSETLTIPTTGSRGTNFPGNLSTPGSVSQEALRRMEEQMKRRAEETVSESRSEKEEEEEEDPISLSFDEEEYHGSNTPSKGEGEGEGSGHLSLANGSYPDGCDVPEPSLCSPSVFGSLPCFRYPYCG